MKLLRDTRVPVAQAEAGTTTLVTAEVVGIKTLCIHEVNLDMTPAGTLVLQDTDGTVFGTWHPAATGKVRIDPVDARSAGRSLAAGKGLVLVTTTGAAAGYVVYSLA